MRLALLMISNFGRADGGRETWAYQFLPRLLQRHPQLRVDVCGLRVDGQDDNRDALLAAIPEADRGRLGITFLRAARNKVPNSVDLIRAVRGSGWPAERPDLALGAGSFIELLAMMAAPRLRGVPKVIWLRTIYVDEKAGRIPAWLRRWARSIETAVLRRADLIIANGQDTADHYRRRGLAVEVIANAVDLDRWRMPPPKFETPIDVAFIGRMTAVKGAREFLELCRRIAAGPHSARFCFHTVGEGEFSAEAQSLADAGLLVHHGTVDNSALPALLASFDACVALGFVSSGRADGSGGSGLSNAVLEQLAAGRLLVAWDNAAYRQAVDERTAVLVPQGDIDALEQAMIAIANDPTRAETMARAGSMRAQDFGFDHHMVRFDSVVLNRHSVAG